MKKFMVLIIAVLMVLSMIYGVYASNDSLSQRVEMNESDRETVREGLRDAVHGLQEQKEKIREFKEELDRRNHTINVEDRNITIKELTDDRKEIIAEKFNAKTGLNLTADEVKGQLGSILSAYLSNGRKALVKFMPDRAAAVALSRLRAKCDGNCTIELKEIGEGNKTRLAYTVQTEKDSKFLWIFSRKMAVKAEVDAETGQVISVQKPWWSFLARERNEKVNATIDANVDANSS